MHGSFDALAGAVRSLGLDPVDGHVYVFFNRRRRIAKALWFDGSGWCVLAKRLEAGTFQLPPLVGEMNERLAELLAVAQRRQGGSRTNASPPSPPPPPPVAPPTLADDAMR